ncbi:hypothetical protein GW17_00051387 [Ensete ventricosum]|nr:hypothetical protein GW17_00051387 [Ensete ventricosum]
MAVPVRGGCSLATRPQGQRPPAIRPQGRLPPARPQVQRPPAVIQQRGGAYRLRRGNDDVEREEEDLGHSF